MTCLSCHRQNSNAQWDFVSDTPDHHAVPYWYLSEDKEEGCDGKTRKEREEQTAIGEERWQCVSKQPWMNKVQNNSELGSRAGRKMAPMPEMEACFVFGLLSLKCLRFD